MSKAQPSQAASTPARAKLGTAAPAAPRAAARQTAPLAPVAKPRADGDGAVKPPIVSASAPIRKPVVAPVPAAPIPELAEDEKTRVEPVMRAASRIVEPAAAIPPAPAQRPGPPPLPASAVAPAAAPITPATAAIPAPPASDPTGRITPVVSTPMLAAEPGPELRAVLQAIVQQATAPLERAARDLASRVGELQRRVDELERRPVQLAAVPAAASHAATAPAPALVAAPSVVAAAPPAPAPTAYGRPAPAAHGFVAAPNATIDAAALDRPSHFDSQVPALDGRRRRARLVASVVALLAVTFGGLFAALAQSYTHAHP
ncbi:MAG TPA: hypothetical protein VE987_08645 [Polyangiaceae bacterium]|nr:hypothetical protein [Polyangiaceae bacterium]